MQDNATGSFPKQELQVGAMTQHASRRTAVRALLLGAQVWVLGCGWPLMEGARDPLATEWTLAGVSLLALVSGVFASRATRLARRLGSASAFVRPLLLLSVFPIALTAAYVQRPAGSNEERYGLLGHLWLGLALCAYGAAASALCDGSPIAITGAPPGPRMRWPLRAFAAICVCGAVALALVAPFEGAPLATKPSWGASDPSGGVLAAIVGGALGFATLAIFLAQALRDRTPMPTGTRKAIRRRALFFALLALVGLGTFAAVNGF